MLSFNKRGWQPEGAAIYEELGRPKLELTGDSRVGEETEESVQAVNEKNKENLYLGKGVGG